MIYVGDRQYNVRMSVEELLELFEMRALVHHALGDAQTPGQRPGSARDLDRQVQGALEDAHGLELHEILPDPGARGHDVQGGIEHAAHLLARQAGAQQFIFVSALVGEPFLQHPFIKAKLETEAEELKKD